METDRLSGQLAFLTEIDRMKSVLRRNILIDRSRREDDAGHSWHIAVCAMVLSEYAADPALDQNRVLRMCLVHDLVEIYAGDTFCYDAAGGADKAARERQAADRLFAMLPPEQGAEFRALWEEFDAMETPEGLFAAAVDRLQPFLLNYNTDGHTWQEARRIDSAFTVADLYRRLDPVRRAMPGLWPRVDAMVRACVERGLLPEAQ